MKLPNHRLPKLSTYVISAGLAVSGLGGCSLDGEAVSIGRTTSSLNLDQCYPTDAGCSDAVPKALGDVAAQARGCAVGRRFDVTAFPLPALPHGFRDMLVGNAVASPDGSFWFLAVGYPEVLPQQGLAMHLFLYQITQDGEELGKVELPLQGEYDVQTNLVVDADGIVTVALSSGAIHFLRFEPGAKLARSVGDLRPLPSQLVAGGSTTEYVVAAESESFDGLGVLSRVLVDGTLERSSNQIPSVVGGRGLLALTSHEQVGYSLLARQPGTETGYRILRYDRDLAPVWTFTLPQAERYQDPTMVADGAGRLLVAEPLNEAGVSALGLYGVSVDGTGSFAFEVPREGAGITNLLLAAEPSTPKLWAHFEARELSGKEETILSGQVAELNAELGSCELHEYPAQGQTWKNALLVAPNGTVFLLTEDSLLRLDAVTEE